MKPQGIHPQYCVFSQCQVEQRPSSKACRKCTLEMKWELNNYKGKDPKGVGKKLNCKQYTNNLFVFYFLGPLCGAWYCLLTGVSYCRPWIPEFCVLLKFFVLFGSKNEPLQLPKIWTILHMLCCSSGLSPLLQQPKCPAAAGIGPKLLTAVSVPCFLSFEHQVCIFPWKLTGKLVRNTEANPGVVLETWIREENCKAALQSSGTNYCCLYLIWPTPWWSAIKQHQQLNAMISQHSLDIWNTGRCYLNAWIQPSWELNWQET